MSTSPTVPVFAPDGSLGDVPYEQLHSAIAAGGKPGVNIKAPDGSLGVIPSEKYQDAAKAGATIVPFNVGKPDNNPGLLSSLGSDLGNMAKGVGDLALAASGNSDAQQRVVGGIYSQIQNAPAQAAAQKKAGYSAFYRAVSPLAQAAGVNVPGMEQSAASGDVGGVVGHAAAPLAAMALAKGVSAGVDAIPTKGGAAANLQAASAKVGSLPIDPNPAGNAAFSVQDLAQSGGQMPKVVRDFIKRVTDPTQTPLTYDEARKFYSNASRLSSNEFQKLTPAMQREVGGFTRALGDSIQDTANQGGAGAEHAAGMSEYRSASQLSSALKSGAKYGVTALGGGYLAHKILGTGR